METLILHPTSTAQWHALVSDAEEVSAIELNEQLESYLVFLLMRFVGKPEMAKSIVANDFLESIEQVKQKRTDTLQEVGDKCLLFAGLFPGIAKTRRVGISYYVKLGQTAYSSLSLTRELHLSELYGSLCSYFVGLMDILQTMRSLKDDPLTLDLLEAYELFQDTKSLNALKTLRRITQGFYVGQGGYPTKNERKH